MAQALSVNRVVNIQIQMGPIAAARADFGMLNIFGDSGVIDPRERSRLYTDIESVASDFGLEAPEYIAATHYFGQIPSPRILMISCWNAVPTPAILKGAVLSRNDANMLKWRTVTDGSFSITLISPTTTAPITINATGIDLSMETNLNGVAANIENAMAQTGPFPAVLIGGVIPDDDQADILAAVKFAPLEISFSVNGTSFTLPVDLTACETMDDIAAALKAADGDNLLQSVSFVQGRFIFVTIATGATASLTPFTGENTLSSSLIKLARLDADTIESNTPGTAGSQKLVLVNWDGQRFAFRSAGTGAGFNLQYLTPVSPATGTDISTFFSATFETGLPPVPGFNSESPVQAVYQAADLSANWYASMFAAEAPITVDQYLAVSAFIEASGRTRVCGVTVTDMRILDALYTEDFSSRAARAGFNRTISQFSSHNPYAVASLFGRMLTVNFSGVMTTITLKFKQQPGITYEELTEGQARALEAKRCNVFVRYNNDTSITQEGVVASGAFIDEIHNLDWLANAIQTELYNVLYTSPTKIPQTEEGIAVLKAVAKSVCEEGVTNGMIGQNLTWTTNGFGALNQGDLLPAGYYLYTVPLVLQPQSERERRKAPVIMIAVKLAGAVHFVDGVIFVSR